MQGEREVETFFDDGDEHVDGDGDPDLGFDGILGIAEEAFDAEVLFDPPEEQFDLPAALVERNVAQGNTDRHRSMVVASRA